MIKHKVSHPTHTDGTPFDSNVYTYRGVVFERDDTRKGYWGHYKTVFCIKGITTSTRKNMLAEIDALLDKAV